jgi:transglutaminase-like putative cysteine protease
MFAGEMKFSVLHRTRYTYATPVKESFNEVRLEPVTNEHQTVEGFMLKVLPPPRLRHYVDFYRNCAHHFEIPEPHTSLTIESQFRVVTNSSNQLDPAARPFPRTRLAECAGMERCFDFLQASPFVELDASVWRQAVDAAGDETDAWQAAQALMRFVHEGFQYTPQLTTVRTRASDVLCDRRGVCQDFAHVLLALCRSIQIPALYVSGYLHTPNANASHAWIEVFLPGIGWRALDPTHGRQPDENYVKLAIGRDYSDAAPTRGHFKGVTERTMEVTVRIEPL